MERSDYYVYLWKTRLGKVVYGAPLARLSSDALRQIQDHLGPFACGGPDKQKSPFADEAIGIIDEELRQRRLFPRSIGGHAGPLDH